jgi:hypothetical protein
MRKAVKGQVHHFVWDPPQPYSGSPSLTVGFDVPLTDELFTQARADVLVSAIANDRRTLTLTESVAVSLERDEVRAFLRTAQDTWLAVKVSRLGGTTAILAEPLPREIDLTLNATLNFSMSYVDISALKTAQSGYFPYSIKFEDLVGGQHVETGLLKVAPRPFNTGLDHDGLVSQFANLADMVPRRQSDFAPQIEAALDEIVLVIRDHVLADNVTEDEVFNQQSFARAHAYCSASMVYEMNMQFDAATAMRERCKELLDVALRSITLDLDGDGVVDEGEENLRRKGGSSTDFRASWRGYNKSASDSFFTPERGMKH